MSDDAGPVFQGPFPAVAPGHLGSARANYGFVGLTMSTQHMDAMRD
jgi:hypothetical protein